jgi:hypothetical protein
MALMALFPAALIRALDAYLITNTMIKPLTDISNLRETFYKVFNSLSPFDPAGRDEFPVRAVLYPTSVYYLEVEQFQALMHALGECGEREFYISMVEWEPESRVWDTKENSHWLCLNPAFEEYEKISLYIENAMYSVSGLWGILQSHEEHALLVCHDELWESFQKHYPNWRQDYVEFIEYWKEVEDRDVDVGWLKPFLAHLTKSPAVGSRI